MNLVKSSFAKKLIVVLVAIIVFNAVMPTRVAAEDGQDWGGILLRPLFSFVASLVGTADAVVGYILLEGWNDWIDKNENGVLDEDEGEKVTIGEVIGDLWDNYVTVGEWWKALWDKDNKLYNEELAKQLPIAGPYLIGVDTIFAGDVKILNANVFSSEDNGSLSNSIRSSVAKIYVTLRNISAVVMLIGLVYTGIQILLNSNIPTKKTQYLMLLQDWVIGMCLLLFSHVIMTIVFHISDLFIDGFSGAITNSNSQSTMNAHLISTIFASKRETIDILGSIPYLVLVCVLIWQLVYFTLAYFRRLLYVNVLVMFAPLFSAMYAFGQQTKQIYSRWLKEYIMTVFVQPFHIIVYYVMIMIPIGAFTSEDANLLTMLYAIVCIFMIKPVEAYLKNLVGLNSGIAGATSYEGGKKLGGALLAAGAEELKSFRAVREAKKDGASAFEMIKAGYMGEYEKKNTDSQQLDEGMDDKRGLQPPAVEQKTDDSDEDKLIAASMANQKEGENERTRRKLGRRKRSSFKCSYHNYWKCKHRNGRCWKRWAICFTRANRTT